MIKEAEIRIDRANEYLGIWRVDGNNGNPKMSLIFSLYRLERLKKLEDSTQLVIGFEFISVGEFKRDYLPNRKIELKSEDMPPTNWSVYREY